jgi:carbon storage regulator
MLVLTRATNQTIMIGDEIEITIVDVRGDKVRVGINAPVTVRVHRKEVYEAIQQANLEAARAMPADLAALSRLAPPTGG